MGIQSYGEDNKYPSAEVHLFKCMECFVFSAINHLQEIQITTQKRVLHRAAVLDSLISTAKLHGHDPYEYLKDLFSRIADHPHHRLAELLPANWGK